MADHTRSLRLAGEVTGESATDLERRLEAASTSIAIDLSARGADAVAAGLVGQLRRLPGQLSVDPTGLDRAVVDRLVGIAHDIDPDRPLAVRRPAEADIRTVLGSSAPASDLRAVADRHGWRLARSGVLTQANAPSGLGIAATAAAVAAEIFKVAAATRERRGPLLDHAAFCPVTLSNDPSDGPDLPPGLHIDAMLLGLGAIGTATTSILGALPVEGEADLVDPQRFAPENVGTYALGGTAAAASQPYKTALAAAALPRFTTREHQEHAADLPGLIDVGDLPWPKVVLAGLDSPTARRDAGRIWPDVLIDGGTGDTMVGLHIVHGAGRPCMACYFPDLGRPIAPLAGDLAAATTLPRAILIQGDRDLTEDDLLLAEEGHRQALREFVGRPICGLASAYGLTELPDEGYQPAVPFVAMSAAALIVGRLIAIATMREPDANFVQYDTLFGPGPRTSDRRHARAGCDCVTRGRIIDQVRATRAGRTGR